MQNGKYAGVDIGGTAIKLGIFSEEGLCEKKWQIATDSRESGRYIPAQIADELKGLAEQGWLLGVGLGVPSPINQAGDIVFATNIGFHHLDMKGMLEDLLKVPVAIANDANVAALGEVWQGGAKGYKNAVMFTLGTGVGGGVIFDGRIVNGANGGAGEIGHIPVEDREEEVCNCQKKGCLEQYASATGIVRVARKILNKSSKESILRAKETLTAKDVFDAVKAGDELAVETAEVFGYYMGKAAACVAGVIDPEIFIIGGGVSAAGPVLIPYIRKNYEKLAFVPSKQTEFALAELGNDAGIYGAARLIMQKEGE